MKNENRLMKGNNFLAFCYYHYQLF